LSRPALCPGAEACRSARRRPGRAGHGRHLRGGRNDSRHLDSRGIRPAQPGRAACPSSAAGARRRGGLALLVGQVRRDLPAGRSGDDSAEVLRARWHLTRSLTPLGSGGCVYQFAMEALRCTRARVIPRGEAWRSGRGGYHVEAHCHSRSTGRAGNLESIERRCTKLGWLGWGQMLRDYRERRLPQLLLR
jgi:hypothetical protein